MKKAIALILIAVICISILPASYAANVCYQISGYGHAERKFTVTTKNFPVLSEKITLTQNKQQYEYRPLFSTSWSKKTKAGYMAYNVYYKRSGDSKWSSKKFTGKSCSLTLKKNSTYTVRVVPYSTSDLNVNFKGSDISWKRIPTWSVSKTRGVELCN